MPLAGVTFVQLTPASAVLKTLDPFNAQPCSWSNIRSAVNGPAAFTPTLAELSSEGDVLLPPAVAVPSVAGADVDV
ncbi:MAG: hypothetical protein NVS2B12_40670 [Ktedonobacteraceae bacterium]